MDTAVTDIDITEDPQLSSYVLTDDTNATYVRKLEIKKDANYYHWLEEMREEDKLKKCRLHEWNREQFIRSVTRGKKR